MQALDIVQQDTSVSLVIVGHTLCCYWKLAPFPANEFVQRPLELCLDCCLGRCVLSEYSVKTRGLSGYQCRMGCGCFGPVSSSACTMHGGVCLGFLSP